MAPQPAISTSKKFGRFEPDQSRQHREEQDIFGILSNIFFDAGIDVAEEPACRASAARCEL
jgi:hypothetical protein